MSASVPPTPAPAPSSSSSAPLSPPLSPLEARVLGCLIEKEASTPDVYPLSLNGLVTACNQRNNRDPVLAVSAAEVEAAIERLRARKLVSMFAGAEARVPKFKHTLGLVFPVEPAAEALLAELLLRGPQTAAGLRGNASRLRPQPDTAEFDALLEALANREAGGLVTKLPRQPGQKEQRWGQRLAEEAVAADAAPAPLTVALTLPPEAEQRFAALESEVARLREELAALRRSLGES